MSDGFDSQAGDLGGGEDLAAGLADSISNRPDESPAQEPQAPAQEAPQHDAEAPKEVGDNPAWGKIRETLGESLYHSIKGHLAEFDKNANGRITSLNAQVDKFKPFEPLVEQGVDVNFAQQAIGLAKQLDENPLDVYNKLGEFLQQTGRMPQNAEELEEALEDGDSEEGVEDDPRLSHLEEQQQRLMDSLREAAYQQQLQQDTQRATDQLTKEIDGIKQANPWMDNQTLGLIVQQAQAELETNGKAPSLTEVANKFIAFRESVLKTPRPNDNAPRLPGSGGGMPSAAKPLDQFTKADDIDALASIIGGGKGR